MGKELSARHALFVQEYLKDGNGSAAYLRAGYKASKAARICAARLLTNANVKAEISRLRKKQSRKFEISRDKWLKELAICGFSDLKNHIEINKDTGAMRARSFKEMGQHSRALESITENRTIHEDAKGVVTVINEKVNFRLHSKIEALKAIGKHLGFLNDKVDVTGKVAAVLKFEYGDPDRKAGANGNGGQ